MANNTVKRGGGEWTRQGGWVAEGLVSTTRTTLIRCTLRNKNNVNPLYPLRLQIEGEDHPVATLSYSTPSSGTFVFVALDQRRQGWQWGDDEDGSDGDGDGNGNGGSLRLREVGGGCVIVPSGDWEEEKSCRGCARQLVCTVP